MEMQDRMSWKALGFWLALMLLVFFVLNGMLSRSAGSLKKEESELRVTLNEKQSEASELRAEIRQIGSDTYVETMARRNLGFVNEGELRFEFANPEALETLTDSEYAILKREMAE